MNIEKFLQEKVLGTLVSLYGEIDPGQVQLQKTRKEFEGDMTLVVFPFLKLSRKKPEPSILPITGALSSMVSALTGQTITSI